VSDFIKAWWWIIRHPFKSIAIMRWQDEHPGGINGKEPSDD